jgi:hypothetical protein
MALLGRISWEFFSFADDPEDIEQEAFNLAYHLRQDYDEVMSWPSQLRRERWQRVVRQYEFEKEQWDRD